MAKRPTGPGQSGPPVKKRKTFKGTDKSTQKLISKITDLEKQVQDALAQNTSLNPLADLLQLASSEDDCEVVLKAVFAIYRLFVQIIRKGLLRSSGEEGNHGKVVRSWILARLDNYAGLLCALLQDEEQTLKLSSLKILFSLLRELSNDTPSQDGDSGPSFDVVFFRRIVSTLLECPTSSGDGDSNIDPDVCDQFANEWLNVYADIRWYFLRESTSFLNNGAVVKEHPSMPANALSILEKLTSIPKDNSAAETQKFWIEGFASRPKSRKKNGDASDSDEEEPEAEEDDWRKFFDSDTKSSAVVGKQGNLKQRKRVHAMSIHEQLHSIAAHRAVFTKCWLTLLPTISSTSASSRNDSEDQTSLVLVTRALTILHHSVLPHLTRPTLIMDWVAGCVDHGGNVGLLALNALFVLMTEYNLDYPRFYTRLYSFLDRNVLHLKHRPRFFRLAELFLSSTHLPVTILASFLKRLARLSLSAPPAAIITVIPFTYNILKQHPALMVLIHRVPESMDDPFLPLETDPTQTHALDSSLWELMSHTRHYHPAISTLARIFGDAFTKPGYAMEDFLDHTYGTLFDTEVNRKMKKEPAVNEVDMPGSQQSEDIVTQLWSIG